ncbi:MAG TPA: iron chelate uptake ABC transporter family permease subunit, partial [Streptomyces sp.]|nr:iron chelate uptake ABC transporter family permease subunit [Streptomyces sp.]
MPVAPPLTVRDEEAHRAGAPRRLVRVVAAAALLTVAVVLSLAVGSRALAPSEVYEALVYGGDGPAAQVVRAMRAPRTLLALLVGAALGLAGSVMQGLTRNP